MMKTIKTVAALAIAGAAATLLSAAPVQAAAGCATTGGAKFFASAACPTPGHKLDKAVYAPGETIRISAVPGRKCTAKVTSPGFVSPISVGGWGVAVAKVGTYVTETTCDGIVSNTSFEIKGKPKPKPQVVKPKGPPQTGGGAMA